MKDQTIFDQAQKLDQQLSSLSDAHQEALVTLAFYKAANRQLAHAIDNNESEKAEEIRTKIKALRDEYNSLTMKLLYHDNI